MGQLNRDGDRAAFGGTRARAGGYGGELGDRAGRNRRIVSSVLLLMDGFALLRDSLLTMLRLGLSDEVFDDAEPLNYISRLDASFNEIYNNIRRFLITHYSVVLAWPHARGRWCHQP